MKQLQFELWQECNSKCTFCYLGRNNCGTPDEVKLTNMNNAIKMLSDEKTFEEYDTIAFIGGEFFQGQLNTKEVKDKFMELMSLTANLLNEGIIKHVWLYATMTIGDQKDLYETLDLFKDTDGDFWVLTSYDTLGRFHTQKMEDNWSYHMKNIHKLYPNFKFNITTIITGDLIEKYLDGRFDFKKIQEEYNTAFFIKLCAGPEGMYSSKIDTNKELGNFFPKRSEFIKFLVKIKKESPELYDKLFNINYRADTLYCEYQGKMEEIHRDKETKLESYNPEIDHIMNCGHLSIYNCYIDSDKCALCDKLKIEDMDLRL